MRDNYRVPGSKCLNCGEDLTGAAPVGGGRGPQPGDISMCFDCGHIQAFGDNLVLRQLTSEEVVEIAGDPQVIFASKMIGEYRERKKQ
jgi:hypothetical protein